MAETPVNTLSQTLPLPDLAHQPVPQTAVPPVTPSIPNPPPTVAHTPPTPPVVPVQHSAVFPIPPTPPLVPNPMAIPNPSGSSTPNPPVPTGNFPHPTGQVDPHIFPIPTATQVAAADKFMEQVWPSILAFVTKIPRFDDSFMGQPHIQQLVGAFAAGLRREFINGNL